MAQKVAISAERRAARGKGGARQLRLQGKILFEAKPQNSVGETVESRENVLVVHIEVLSVRLRRKR